MENNIINEELKKAVNDENVEKVKAYLSAGANANYRVERNRDTLLHIVDSAEIAKELLLAGAEVNAYNMYSEIPLHTAITRLNNLELVTELLKHGADVNITNRKGNTALNLAVNKSYINLEIIKEILKYGADINIRNRERTPYQDCETPLDNAIARSLDRAQLLIKFTLIRNFNKNYLKVVDLSPYKENKSKYNNLSSYLDDCVCEILQMKTDEIIDNLTLYELVTNNFNIHLLCNNPLSVRLSKKDFSIHYPIYIDIILDKVKPFLERANLLNKLSKTQFYTKLDKKDENVKKMKIILDHDSTYNITEYLSNDNLLNLIVVFGDSHEHAFQSLSSSNDHVETGTRFYETTISNDSKRARLQ